MARAAIVTRHVRRSDGAAREDELAVEEPLEIRLLGETLAVTLRTPGEDEALTIGYLFAEGVITGTSDLSTVVHCGKTTDEAYGNLVEVTPAPGAHAVLKRVDRTRRLTVTTSACGLCGRATIDDLLELAGPVPSGPPLSKALLASGPARLRKLQVRFERTGAVHGAVLLDQEGAVLGSGEDVGRHNAVDKAVGRWLLAGAAGRPAVLVVSGRAGFDVVQKAAMVKVRAVVSVSAATGLAADTAERLGLTLAGFCRDGAFTVYAHPERVG